MNKLLPSILLCMSGLAAAQDACSTRPAPCYSADVCQCQYCLGPSSRQGNAPARPHTCGGDVVIAVSGLYLKATQDGLEYAVKDNVEGALFDTALYSNLKNLVNAEYLTPKSGWTGGYGVSLAYNSPCDGWDIGLQWNHYKVSNHDVVQAAAVADDTLSTVLLTLWSAFHGLRDGAPNFAHRIDSNWKLNLGILDLELGREFWVSKYLSLRPFISLEGAMIDQELDLQQQGGYWVGAMDADTQLDAINEVELTNDFKGVGVRSGLEGNWHLGCGWSIYSHLAAAILSGRFNIAHDEANREAVAPFSKYTVLDTSQRFRASRPTLELGLGLQYQTLVCDCAYGLKARLAWEENLYFHQNQMWRVDRVDPEATNNLFPNNGGENVFFQRRGTLATQGWTLTIQFEF